MKYLRAYDNETQRALNEYSLGLPNLVKVREPLKVYADGNYIKYGLIFHLDGWCCEDDSGWTDIVSNITFVNNGCDRGKGGAWIIPNTTSTKNSLRYDRALPFASGTWNTHTIECVYYTIASRAQSFLSPMSNNTISIGLSAVANRFLISTSSSNCQYDTPTGTSARGFHTVSINVSGGLMDGSISITNTPGNNCLIAGGYSGIGASSATNYPFDGEIYAIRVYNRLLSVEEMRINQKIDMKRFKDLT